MTPSEAQIGAWDQLGGVLDRVSEGLVLLDGEGRVLRANRPARRLLGSPNGASGDESWLDLLAGGEAWRREQIEQACWRGGPLHLEVATGTPGQPRRLSIQLSPILPDQTIAWIRDLTRLHELEDELRLRASYQEATIRILRAREASRDRGAFLDRALAIIGQARGVSRSYIFEQDEARRLVTCTHEWTAPGIEPFCGLTAAEEDFPFWCTELRANRAIAAADIVRDLPEELHEILKLQGILSILAVPLHGGGRLWGFLGLDECVACREWTGLEVRLFRALGDLISCLVSGRSEGAPPRRGAPEPLLDHEPSGP